MNPHTVTLVKALNEFIADGQRQLPPGKNRANDLKDVYDNPDLLPMIMVQTPDGVLYQPGVEKLEEILRRRIHPFIPEVNLGQDIFEDSAVVEQLCLASGGHVRELLLLMKEALNRADGLPIPTRAVRRAIAETRDTYRRTVEEHQWPILAKVAKTRTIDNDEDHRDLLFRRCVMEYRFFDDDAVLHVGTMSIP